MLTALVASAAALRHLAEAVVRFRGTAGAGEDERAVMLADAVNDLLEMPPRALIECGRLLGDVAHAEGLRRSAVVLGEGTARHDVPTSAQYRKSRRCRTMK